MSGKTLIALGIIGISAVAALAESPASTTDPAVMAARIDELLAKSWEKAGVTPAPLTTDAQLLRRASLDLTGIIPSVTQVRKFVSDTRPDKRARLIDDLLEKPRHATHMAATWRTTMLPGNVDLRRFGNTNGFERWLRDHFADNVPYDQMVREVLLTEGNFNQGAALFYMALALKPEELAASTSRIFLGVQISCAQCHDHPFDHWTQDDFWGYAAFFGRLQQPNNPQQARATQVRELDEGELKLPGTEEIAYPRYLGGELADPESDTKRRELLADWMTSPDNPYFAKATVNRLWGILFGRGLVHPIDDLGKHNPPSHPQVLEELSHFFVANNFDLRQVIRAIAYTRAYQLSSRMQSEEELSEKLFARMAVKSLTPEQLHDCLLEAMRKRDFGRGVNAFANNRQAFLTRFGSPATEKTDFEAGIPQALTIMNGTLVSDATDLQNSDLLVSLHAPFFTNEERVNILFMSTLSRLPSADEKKQFVEYVNRGGPRGNLEHALGDVLWALLNSGEFMLNH